MMILLKKRKKKQDDHTKFMTKLQSNI